MPTTRTLRATPVPRVPGPPLPRPLADLPKLPIAEAPLALNDPVERFPEPFAKHPELAQVPEPRPAPGHTQPRGGQDHPQGLHPKSEGGNRSVPERT